MTADEINKYIKEKQEKGLDPIGCWQVKIAANMGLSRESLDLMSVPSLSFTNREWIYIALMEQVPAEWLISLSQVTAQGIIELRQKYFKQQYGASDLEEFNNLKEAVNTQMKESRMLCTFLKERESEAANYQKQLQEIEAQEGQKFKSLQAEKKLLEEQLVESRNDNTRLMEELFRLQERLKKTAQEFENQNLGEETSADRESYISSGCFLKKLVKRWIFHRQIRRDNDEFIVILQKNKFSSEQKEYLLKCREAGDDMTIIRNIAFETFDVETMKRLRSILTKKGEIENGETGMGATGNG